MMTLFMYALPFILTPIVGFGITWFLTGKIGMTVVQQADAIQQLEAEITELESAAKLETHLFGEETYNPATYQLGSWR